MPTVIDATTALADIWRGAALPSAALAGIDLPDEPACLPSSFNVGVAAQASIGAAALAATQIYQLRTSKSQAVRVRKQAAELECTGYFELDGNHPNAWEKFSGLYATRDGHVRLHANFAHHRDGILKLLGLPGAAQVAPADVAAQLSQWSALEFEDAAAQRGLVATKVRSFAEWDAHPQALATRDQPLIVVNKVADAPPRQLPPLSPAQRPLTGVRTLDLTRILAGPICGRTLAAYGSDVLLINSPSLPNIASITDTSRGKRSALLDLKSRAGVATLQSLLAQAHIFVQGYRPGGLAALGFAPQQLAQLSPGIISVSLSAYGHCGPWSERRGFDSLVQTACGFNHAEAAAAGADLPKPLPVPIFDYAAGFLMAFGAQAALYQQMQQGGSWHVQVSLLQTAAWLRSLGRLPEGLTTRWPKLRDHLQAFPCTTGDLYGPAHAAELSVTPATWLQPSAVPGTHEPNWRQ